MLLPCCKGRQTSCQKSIPQPSLFTCLAEVQNVALDEVNHAAGSAHSHIHATAQISDLLSDVVT